MKTKEKSRPCFFFFFFFFKLEITESHNIGNTKSETQVYCALIDTGSFVPVFVVVGARSSAGRYEYTAAFGVFDLLTLYSAYFVWARVPETKGLSLEQIQHLLSAGDGPSGGDSTSGTRGGGGSRRRVGTSRLAGPGMGAAAGRPSPEATAGRPSFVRRLFGPPTAPAGLRSPGQAAGRSANSLAYSSGAISYSGDLSLSEDTTTDRGSESTVTSTLLDIEV